MSDGAILVGYDGSPDARTALSWALDEATHSGRPVRLAYAFEWLTPGSWAGPGGWSGAGLGGSLWPDEQARRDAEEVVRAAVTEATRTHPGHTVRGEVLDGPPAPLLQDQSTRADLVVLGSRGYGGFTGLLVGSTAVAVSAHAHCPVVVVRDPGDGPHRPAGRIVVGVDGSPESELALDFALARAAARAVPLVVLRAWSTPGPLRLPPGSGLSGLVPAGPPGVAAGSPELAVGEAEYADAERAALDEVLTPRRAAHPSVPVTTEVVSANPAEALVRASRDAQLTVVGSRGRGGFRGMLLGSVSQQLIQHGHGPVAVVRELPGAHRSTPSARSG